MKRIAHTTAPHPIDGHDAYLEIFDLDADTIMRCTRTDRDGIDTIIYSGKKPDAVMRETGLFWNVDAELGNEPIAIPAKAWAKVDPGDGRPSATVTIYDDGTGRALLQRVDDAAPHLTVTWKSPEYSVADWMRNNEALDWHHIGPSIIDQATAAPPKQAEEELIVQRAGGWFVTGTEWSGPWASKDAAIFAAQGLYNLAHQRHREDTKGKRT